MKTVYFDYAAATPVSEEVFTAMRPYFTEKFYNPSATYMAAQDARKDLEDARARIAAVLGARKNEIIFTAGGTEANNLAVRGVLEQFPGSSVAVSSIEHDSILGPAEVYGHAIVQVNEQGLVDIDDLERKITDTTVLVSIMYANNEIGTIQPIRRITGRIKEIRIARKQSGNTLPLYVHTDACQATNYLDMHVSRLGIDMMTINGGKMYGPKQSGVLYVASNVRFAPQILGGGQERGKRSGTENIAFAVGLAAALEAAQTARHDHLHVMTELQQYFLQTLKTKLPNVIINGSLKQRLPNNIHVTLPGADNERLIFALDERGIQVAAGSACSASSELPSHVLRAVGMSDLDAQASLRFTMGRDTTKNNIDAAVEALTQIVYTKA
jgi:cysteine desulfurase